MQKLSVLKMKGKTPSSSSSSTMHSTPFSTRSQRSTHNPLLLQNITNFGNLPIKDQIDQISKNADFVLQKSLILFKYDQKLEQFIKKNKPSKKQGQKMKIFSMKKVKLKLNQKNTYSKRDLNKKSVYQFSINLNFNSFRRAKQKGNCPSSSNLSVNRRQAGLYVQTNHISSLKQYLRILVCNYADTPKRRKSQLMADQLINYIQRADKIELQKQLVEVQSISNQMINCLANSQTTLPVNMFRKVNRDLTKLFFNIFYEIYRKKQRKPNYFQLIRINKEVQYSARRLGFFTIALRTCFDLGKIYCDKNQYDKAFQQYSNAVKLSVYLNDVYYQQIAIDKLGLCKYYLGDSTSALYFHNNLNNLSQYDLNRIKQQYSNQHQIQRLVQQKKQLTNSININNKKTLKRKLRRAQSFAKQKKQLLQNIDHHNQSDKLDIGQFTFDKQNRIQGYPYHNQIQFKANLKKIIKVPQLRQKIHIIKKSLKKNDQIGMKKYFGQTYVLPKADTTTRKQVNHHQNNSVCLSHRSYNRKNVQMQSEKLDKQTQFLVNILVYFRDNQSFKKKQTQVTKQSTNRSLNQLQV